MLNRLSLRHSDRSAFSWVKLSERVVYECLLVTVDLQEGCLHDTSASGKNTPPSMLSSRFWLSVATSGHTKGFQLQRVACPAYGGWYPRAGLSSTFHPRPCPSVPYPLLGSCLQNRRHSFRPTVSFCTPPSPKSGFETPSSILLQGGASSYSNSLVTFLSVSTVAEQTLQVVTQIGLVWK